MSEDRYWRRRAVDRVIDQLRRDDSPPRIDRELRGGRGFSEDEPAAAYRRRGASSSAERQAQMRRAARRRSQRPARPFAVVAREGTS